MKKDKFLLVHSGSGIGIGGIERVNHEILAGWKEVSELELVPFEPKKNILSIIRYIGGIRDKSIKSTIFMHLGLTKFLLFGRPPGSVKVFLHGIEAWKKLPAWHKFLLNGVDHFISNSQFTWDRFIEFNPEFSKVRHDVVHLGIGEPTEYQDPDPDVPAALIIGRMSKSEDYKGHRELIAVWPEVRKAVPNAELWIAGTGDLKPELEILAKRHEGIRFFGKVSEEEKHNLLCKCRCLVMPSRNEGFGLVYLEAMRLGRPSFVSNCDAGREVIALLGENYVLDIMGPVDEFVSQIQSGLLLKGNLIDFGKKIAQIYIDNYTSKKFVHRLMDCFGL